MKSLISIASILLVGAIGMQLLFSCSNDTRSFKIRALDGAMNLAINAFTSEPLQVGKNHESFLLEFRNIMANITKYSPYNGVTRDIEVTTRSGWSTTYRISYPDNYDNNHDDETLYPVFVWIHGGGWVIGEPKMHDDFVLALARQANCIVVSVRYHLAPEHRFPTAHDDALDSIYWVHQHATEFRGDPDKIFVGGESAGANLAASVAIKLRDDQATNGFLTKKNLNTNNKNNQNTADVPSILGQYLAVPVVEKGSLFPSYSRYAKGYVTLTADQMSGYELCYHNNDPDAMQRMFPARASSHINLPPALIHKSEFDVLADQADYYHEILSAAGVQSELVSYPVVHAALAGLYTLHATEGNQAIQSITEWINKLLQQK